MTEMTLPLSDERSLFYSPRQVDRQLGFIADDSAHDIFKWRLPEVMGLNIRTSAITMENMTTPIGTGLFVGGAATGNERLMAIAVLFMIPEAGMRWVHAGPFKREMAPLVRAMCHRMDEVQPKADGQKWTSADLVNEYFKERMPNPVMRKTVRALGEIPAFIKGRRIASVRV